MPSNRAIPSDKDPKRVQKKPQVKDAPRPRPARTEHPENAGPSQHTQALRGLLL